MKKGLVEFDWNDIEKYTDEEITYFLFVEGKSLDSICKIRKIDRPTVQNHIIEGKIKYRFLTKSRNTEEFFESISKAGKQDKLSVLKSLDKDSTKNLVQFIRENYVEMYPKEKEAAIWILGELREIECMDILMKASVHKSTNVRRMAISAMGKMQDNRCEIALIRALDDENPQVITYAIKALGKIKSVNAREKIEYIKNNTDKQYIREAAENFLNGVV
ncbi:HEAT repeat domain-containing protein [Clostridium sp. MB40-C1]|uniref:HEAT repeat domain-containing protein n=1 Tax=Clostridium sp. MB40-C1 TaxID=3070996 RepID=UPI0027DFCD38|nr:HEAT repeat domain-containing protein [Clostridium sp. MB40-C1]WMJ81213.1 HEAT repeat domain-containing protein [Clostridium sp. MB40-C1]